MVNKNVIDFTNASNGKYTNWSPEKCEFKFIIWRIRFVVNHFSVLLKEYKS